MIPSLATIEPSTRVPAFRSVPVNVDLATELVTIDPDTTPEKSKLIGTASVGVLDASCILMAPSRDLQNLHGIGPAIVEDEASPVLAVVEATPQPAVGRRRAGRADQRHGRG